MSVASFESWMETFRRAASREEVELDLDDERYRHYYDQGHTPRGALIDIVEFED